MANINADIQKMIQSTSKLVDITKRMGTLRNRLEMVKVRETYDSDSIHVVDASIRKLTEHLDEDILKADSLSDALKMIVKKYEKCEKDIISSNILKEAFIDWVASNKVDSKKATPWEKEQAADNAMRDRLREVLRDEKYSQENWDKASVKERKKILQDYMNEVIAIYGLKNVKSTINWDNNATYERNEITWGYYNNGTRKVTLNERALSDSLGNWDSYKLIGTVAHELRHAYQHEAVENPSAFQVSSETVDSWRNNFANYISSSVDHDGYYAQPVEVDARSFEV